MAVQDQKEVSAGTCAFAEASVTRGRSCRADSFRWPAAGKQMPRRKSQPAVVDEKLAEWIASGENPLTRRVMVNRIWHHLIGQGLVRTTDNFGVMGEVPSHPGLLDWLRLVSSLVTTGR